MRKVLFLIHDLGKGGAEKVLVNLVNHMDARKFNITVMVLFGGGENEKYLNKNIRLIKIFPVMIPGNTKLLKLLSPSMLHSLFIHEKFDIEVSYLEGPSARVISGCKDLNVKLVNWVHEKQRSMEMASGYFRSSKEAQWCYSRFDRHIFVSEDLKKDFEKIFYNIKKCEVLYNTVESGKILKLSEAKIDFDKSENVIRLIAVGTLKHKKGYDRLLQITLRLKNEGYNNVQLFILGEGPDEDQLKQFVKANDMNDFVIFWGYQENPYKFVAHSDLFVCASYAEGFSTAATEALIVGTPVCTVEVSGMREMLGENNEYGIVTENSEEKLYQGIKMLLDKPDLLAHYKKQAKIRGKMYSTDNTVRAVEEMLLSL